MGAGCFFKRTGWSLGQTVPSWSASSCQETGSSSGRGRERERRSRGAHSALPASGALPHRPRCPGASDIRARRVARGVPAAPCGRRVARRCGVLRRGAAARDAEAEARAVTPFVQLSYELWTAWQRGELSQDERDLALHIAFNVDFRTGFLATTLPAIGSELGWSVVDTTTGRRLERLRQHGFVEVEVVGRRPKQRHLLKPTSKLLRSGRLAQAYAGSRAGTDAGLEAASENGSRALPAGVDAGSRAGEEEKRRRDLYRETGSRGAGWVEKLSSYTGCRLVRGTHALGHRHDVLGTDRPPADWPYPRPTRQEVLAALAKEEAALL